MRLSTDRMLTTHVGSLPRTPAVFDALLAREHGTETDPGAFDATVADGVRQVLRQQAAAGVDIVSDGEMSKTMYSTYVIQRLSGFSNDDESPSRPNMDMREFPDFAERHTRMRAATQVFRRPRCTGPVAMQNMQPVHDDIARFKAALAKQSFPDAFMNAASPGVIAVFLSNSYYPTEDAYLAALAEAMAPEYRAIVDAGLVLQVDAPDLAMGRHSQYADLDEAAFLERAEAQVAALNQALDGIPADRVRLHLCWGNYEGPHTHDIPLEAILPVALKANAQAISFEGANPRHEHEWEVFKHLRLPDDRVIIPGILDSTTNFVEHPRLVAQRIERYASVVGRERVLAGADCGFATSASSSTVDPVIAFAKLRSLAEGAAMASDTLW